MKRKILLAAVVAASPQLMAAGYKIPEQSMNSTALSAAYVANAHGADAAYFNPANMAFETHNSGMFELAVSDIYVKSQKYTGNFPAGGYPISESSESENALAPHFHYVSPEIGEGTRIGLSVVAPAGNTKRWEGTLQAVAEEFTLQTVEFNPSIAHRVNEQFAIGAGLRAIYDKGTVRINATQPLSSPIPYPDPDNGPYYFDYLNLTQLMKGDSWEFGYNLAATFKPNEQLTLAATYRSKIDLNPEGTAIIGATLIDIDSPYTVSSAGSYNDWATVGVPVPATLSLAAAYGVSPSTTVEFVFERNYWSDYKQLDFDYLSSLTASFLDPNIPANLEAPKQKQWKDANAFRIGITHQLNNQWTLMGGFAIDQSPVPEQYLGAETPDSDQKMISFGARYQYSDDLSIGGSFLYARKDDIDLSDAGNAYFDGTFSGGRVYFTTVGMEYKF